MTRMPRIRSLFWLPAACAAAVLCLAACGSGAGPAGPAAAGDTASPASAASGDASGSDAAITQTESVEKSALRVLVRPAEGEDIEAIVRESGGRIVKRVDGTDFFLVALPAGTNLEAFIEHLEGDVRVLESEPDRRVSSPEGGGATLPLGGDFFEFQIANQGAMFDIGADVAVTRATGAGVVIAVIDSGVDDSHNVLAGRIAPGGWDFVGDDADPTDEPNGVDDDDDGLVDEGWGHGTFVSSLILTVAPDALVLPYRVLDSDSNGIASDLAEAIVLATDAGADAINLSLGMEYGVGVVREAVRYAKEHGVVVVVSAGNTGQEDVTFPASIPDAFAVAALGGLGEIAPFASYGSDVDLSAPGLDILGAYPTAPDVAVLWPGSSFSAALVSGGFALLRELHPLVPAEGLLAHLKETSEDVSELSPPEYAGKMGAGRLDLDAATLDAP